jgi:citrate/tricarballylate utilization protein
MERRREFSDGDLTYLANLCHNCRGCFYACQYAPPHPFAVNVPRAFSELRAESYAAYAWPGPLARLFQRNGLVVSVAAALSIALVLLLAVGMQDPDVLFGTHREPGAFYLLIPGWLMIAVAGGTFGFSLVALAIGALKFWRGTGSPMLWRPMPLLAAVQDALTLTNLSGGGEGCNDRSDRFTQQRRWLHHTMFYGFALCFASTTAAAVYEHFLGRLAPYPLLSLPVVLGTLGGVGMVIGTGGLIWVKVTADPAPAAPGLMGADFALLFLLLLTAATGLLLLALRSTPAMGILLAVHLGFVLALFLVMPYSKFVHGIYRAAALWRNAIEQRAIEQRGA